MYLEGLAWPKGAFFKSSYDSRLKAMKQDQFECVGIAERDPILYLATVFASRTLRIPCFLCNPSWGDAQWGEFFGQVKPDVLWAEDEITLGHKESSLKCSMKMYRGLVMIPTGGSGGKVRFVMHRWESLDLSARVLARHWCLDTLNTVNVLPLAHVSGLMCAWRAFATGGQCVLSSPLEVMESPPLLDNAKPWVLSLVPTLLVRFLQSPTVCEWMRTLYAVIIGGAHLDDTLFEQARALGIPVVRTYGASETASMVTIENPQSPGDGVGQVLPHAWVECPPTADGVGEIKISSSSLFCGYYPQKHYPYECWESGDYGVLKPSGHLTVWGRKDGIINSGGEKVAPWEVERLLIKTGLVRQAYVMGLPDATWGERVVAAYVPKGVGLMHKTLEGALRHKCAPWMVPKEWLSLQQIPVNDRGKVDRALLSHMFAKASS